MTPIAAAEDNTNSATIQSKSCMALPQLERDRDFDVRYLSLTPLGSEKLAAVHSALGPERAQLRGVMDSLND